MEIYNILGQRLIVILDERGEAGSHALIRDAGDIPSGVYFYRIQADDYTETKKMVPLK